MNEDYLWDKSGENEEIEQLESSLKSFRSNAAPPKLPAKTFVVDHELTKPKSPSRFFRLTFASLACIALFAVSIGVFRFMQTEKLETVLINTEETQKLEKTLTAKKVLVNEEPPKEIVPEKAPETKQKITKTLYISKTKPRKRVYRASSRISKRPKRAKTVEARPKENEQKKDTIILTKEEKDAYDQLMRALTITSSKLKIVKDKVKGAE